MENGLSQRLKAVIDSRLPELRRLQSLEEQSTISSESWRKCLAGKQKPTLEMIEFVCTTWPEHAFWLCTGIPDGKYGHIAPSKGLAPGNTSRLFHEYLTPKGGEEDTKYTIEKGFQVLSATGVMEENSDLQFEHLSRRHILETLRKFEIFFDNYILDLSIDEAISTYNSMRAKMKIIESSKCDADIEDAIQNTLRKFSSTKESIEQKRDWITAESAKGK